MKNFLFLFIQLLIVQAINCQSNQFPIENGEWKYLNCDINSNLSSTKTRTLTGDSLYNNLTYSKFSGSSSLTGEDSGLLRVENEKVFFIPKDSIVEILLYDFSLEVGDTFYLAENWFLFSPDYLVVNSIDSILIMNGDYRKRINFNSENYWIAGIGAYSGPVTHPWYFESLSGGMTLICLQQNSEVIFEQQTLCPVSDNPIYGCEGLIINTNEVEDIDFKIYPNLLDTENEIKIESKNLIKEVKVFDMKLNLIKNRLEHNIIYLDSNLVPGMYILQIISEKGLVSKRFIKL
jgi:hypothetical protein